MKDTVFGPRGTYNIQDLKESRYELFSCARKTILLPSHQTSTPDLIKHEYVNDLYLDRPDIFQPLEKLLGAKPRFEEQQFALFSSYPVRILRGPQSKAPKI